MYDPKGAIYHQYTDYNNKGYPDQTVLRQEIGSNVTRFQMTSRDQSSKFYVHRNDASGVGVSERHGLMYYT